MVSNEAVFLISLATEAFIKRLASDAADVAKGNGRTTVSCVDIGTYARVFEFL